MLNLRSLLIERKALIGTLSGLLFLYVFLTWPRAPVMRKLPQKVIVLGFDGVEPTLFEKYLGEGHFPNLEELIESGSYYHLGTTHPSESPVAWSSFSTGLNPGKHGIFGFLKHNWTTYLPYIGTTKVDKGDVLFNWEGEDIMLPPKLANMRHGEPMWVTLTNNRIPAVMMFMPISLPADDIPGSELLAGLGVSDLRGTWGTFTYFAEDIMGGENLEMGGDNIRIPSEGIAEAYVTGPKKKELPVTFEFRDSEVDITVQGATQTVPRGGWSDWFELSFTVNLFFQARGIARFYVVDTNPRRVYMTPINIHPRDPVIPICYPADLSSRIADKVGLFKTIGWPTRTWALKEERIDDETYLEDAFYTFDQRANITYRMLEDEPWNLFISVFMTTDQVQHSMWRHIDPLHPMYDPAEAAVFNRSILDTFIKMDEIVGYVMDNYVDENTTLIILSDHGFKSFRKDVNLNTWLAENGLMKLTSLQEDMYTLNDLQGDAPLFWRNVDWSRTKAYAISLGEIYVNLKGREGRGIVEPDDYDAVRDQIIEGLLALRDPETNETVISNVYKKEEIYIGPFLDEAPDLLVGFRDGYRVSWQTSLGGAPAPVIADHMQKWSGDHCSYDPVDIPGIFIINRKLNMSSPEIIDLAPTILAILNTTPPEGIDGKSLV